jgi:hypothetical protein
LECVYVDDGTWTPTDVDDGVRRWGRIADGDVGDIFAPYAISRVREHKHKHIE